MQQHATSSTPAACASARKSKTAAAWLALLLGAFGVHRLYLHGPRDVLAWLHLLPTGAGLLGLAHLLQNGQDDKLAWLLLPVLGLMLSQGMLCAIVHGLTSDERWDARHNPGLEPVGSSWAAVLAAAAGLLVGGALLMGTIAYSGQKYFEWELESQRAAARS